MNVAIFSSNGSNLYRSFKSFEKSIPSYPKVWSRAVQREVGLAVQAKNVKLHKFHAELEAAKEQVRALQQQILAFKSRDDPIIERDEDYFNSQMQATLWVRATMGAYVGQANVAPRSSSLILDDTSGHVIF